MKYEAQFFLLKTKQTPVIKDYFGIIGFLQEYKQTIGFCEKREYHSSSIMI